MSASLSVECPSCGELAPEGANWCEACGADLAAEPVPPCVSCGERTISNDGYCMTCGYKQPGERDHLVFEDGTVVAVTDRGLRHHHNEDAVAVGSLEGGGAVLVVCDGVSSTPGSAEASLGAATAARDLLVARLDGTDGPPPWTGDDTAEAMAAMGSLLSEAAAAAQDQAAQAPEITSNAPYAQGGPPSSTLVVAIGRPTAGAVEVSVAWLGDSRAYWVDDNGALPLTEDHEIGGSLTQWLGADSVDSEPDISHHRALGAGRLLLCSDGLWRYAPEPAELAALVGRLESEHEGDRALAEALVDHAVGAGGHDNISVAVWTGNPIGESEPADE